MPAHPRRALAVLAAILLGVTLFAWAGTPAQAVGTWAPTTDLAVGRTEHSATLLADGRVLVVGGQGGSGVLKSAELYNPGTPGWQTAQDLSTPRSGHRALRLNDGRVLVIGGYAGGSTILTSAELYNPTDNRWTPTENTMAVARNTFAAALLPSGKVLVSGGFAGIGGPATPLPSAEIYDPATNRWSAAAAMAEGRYDHILVTLPNGKVLAAGGVAVGGTPAASAELYDPGTNTWAPTGSMRSGRYASLDAALLSGGKVLVAGGLGMVPVGGIASLDSYEIYDSTSGQWSGAITNRLSTTYRFGSLTSLPDGRVLLTALACCPAELATEIYYPDFDEWRPDLSTQPGRSSHTATLLGTGKVLVAGGRNGDDPSAAGFLKLSQLYTPQAFTPTELTVSVSDSPDPVVERGYLTCTITVTNAGRGTATDILLTDTLPVGVKFAAWDASQGLCSGTATVLCSLGTLSPSGTARVRIAVQALTAGTVTNSVAVKANEARTTTASQTTSVTTPPSGDSGPYWVHVEANAGPTCNFDFHSTNINRGTYQQASVTSAPTPVSKSGTCSGGIPYNASITSVSALDEALLSLEGTATVDRAVAGGIAQFRERFYMLGWHSGFTVNVRATIGVMRTNPGPGYFTMTGAPCCPSLNVGTEVVGQIRVAPAARHFDFEALLDALGLSGSFDIVVQMVIEVPAGITFNSASGVFGSKTLDRVTVQNASSGATVTTDTDGNGATGIDPVETSVTSPNGGTVTIEESAATTTPPPSGYNLLETQVAITAPSAVSFANPIAILFRLDAALVPPGETQDTIQVYRNGTRVPDCTVPNTVSPEQPTCISRRSWPSGGDVEITVLTMQASIWNFAVPVPAQQAIDDIVARVNGLLSAGTLNSGQGTSLTAHLQTAKQKLSQGDTTAARGALRSFINEVRALVNSRRLMSAQGQPLIDMAQAVVDRLATRPR